MDGEPVMMANKAEIKLGQLAIERTQNADVRQFAQMMVNDHTKALKELTQAAKGSVRSRPSSIRSTSSSTID